MLSYLLSDNEKRFILVGGKGGTGKTSSAAATALSLAEAGQKTLVISTDPAHSLSDSFDQIFIQGQITKVIDSNGDLFALELDPEQSSDDFADLLNMAGSSKDELKQSINSFGLEEINDLLTTMPPGFDEALAIAKILQVLKQPEYEGYQKVVFDTAPTGHTLRLLSLPGFLDVFLSKTMRLKAKINNIFGGFKSIFGVETQKDRTIEVIENLQTMIEDLRMFFQDEKKTEFIVVTIPTVMAINESERLVAELKRQNIKVNSIIVNQIMPENLDCKFCMARSSGQKKSLETLQRLFASYNIIQIPFFDQEIRGSPALRVLGNYLFNSSQSPTREL